MTFDPPKWGPEEEKALNQENPKLLNIKLGTVLSQIIGYLTMGLVPPEWGAISGNISDQTDLGPYIQTFIDQGGGINIYSSKAAFPLVGNGKQLYIALDKKAVYIYSPADDPVNFYIPVGNDLSDIASQLGTLDGKIDGVDQDLADHKDDVYNPHKVSLQQVASQTGTGTDKLIELPVGVKLYEGNDSANEANKLLTRAEVETITQGGSQYMGLLNYGASDPLFGASITGMKENDRLGVHSLQTTYYFSKTEIVTSGTIQASDGSGWWIPVTPVNPDKVGYFYDIAAWYGNYGGSTFNGNATGKITCVQESPPKYDLIVQESTIADNYTLTTEYGNLAVNIDVVRTLLKLRSIYADYKDITTFKFSGNDLAMGVKRTKCFTDYGMTNPLPNTENFVGYFLSCIDKNFNTVKHVGMVFYEEYAVDVVNARIILFGEEGNVKSIDGIHPEDHATLDVKTRFEYETMAEYLADRDNVPPNALAVIKEDFKEVHTGYGITPDFSNMETINRIANINYPWTAEKTGFVQLRVAVAPISIVVQTSIDISFLVNGVSVDRTYPSLAVGDGAGYGLQRTVVIPVTKGDQVSISVSGQNYTVSNISCYFIPPKVSSLEVPRAVILPGSDYSTAKSPVMVIEDGVSRQKKDVGGNPVWCQVISGTLTATANTFLQTTLKSGIRKLLNYSGWWDPYGTDVTQAQFGDFCINRSGNTFYWNSSVYFSVVNGTIMVCTESNTNRTNAKYELYVEFTEV
jgi:hypothetical protein